MDSVLARHHPARGPGPGEGPARDRQLHDEICPYRLSHCSARILVSLRVYSQS